MNFFDIFGIALGLAMDAFAVAIASSVSLGCVSGRQIFRLSFHFGLFQAMMPLIGWLAGLSLERKIAAYDHWLALLLLGFIGIKAIVAAVSDGDEDTKPNDPTRGITLISLSVATSLDALAVGITLGVQKITIWYPIAVIGIVASLLTILGMLFGCRLGSRFGKKMEIAGGLVLIGIGIKIFMQHGLEHGFLP